MPGNKKDKETGQPKLDFTKKDTVQTRSMERIRSPMKTPSKNSLQPGDTEDETVGGTPQIIVSDTSEAKGRKAPKNTDGDGGNKTDDEIPGGSGTRNNIATSGSNHTQVPDAIIHIQDNDDPFKEAEHVTTGQHNGKTSNLQDNPLP